MPTHSIARILIAMIFFALASVTARADRREITFPRSDGEVTVWPGDIAFAHDGQVGFTLVYTNAGRAAVLFSFSPTESRVVDEFDLAPDFGIGNFLIAMKVHAEAGLVVVFGADSTGIPKVLALSSDREGHLRKLWLSQFSVPSVFPAGPALTFNDDGSRIYFIYDDPAPQSSLLSRGDRLDTESGITANQPRQSIALLCGALRFRGRAPPQPTASSPRALRLALVRAEDGSMVDTFALSFTDTSGSLFFNEVRNQLIALSGGIAYVFTPASNRLEVESSIAADFDGGEGVDMSQNGGFLIAHAGYSPLTAKSGVNNYVVYDLELKKARTFLVNAKLFPFSNDLVFHRPTSTLFVPMKARLTQKRNGTISLVLGGFRETDILNLTAEGALTLTAQVELPEFSPESSVMNGLFPFNNVVVSKTGALAFVASGNGRLFTIDTITGEIVNDELIDDKRLLSIHLVEPLNLLAFGTGTNKINLVGISTGPVVSSVSIKESRTIVSGKNFLTGTHIQINGVDLGLANRRADDPGHKIIINLGKKDFPRAQDFSVVVVNRDGLRSEPFTFRRP